MLSLVVVLPITAIVVGAGVNRLYLKNLRLITAERTAMQEKYLKEVALRKVTEEERQKELAERRLLAAQLALSAAEDSTLDALRETAGHGVMKLDLEGRVIGWNKALEEWTGYAQVEMVGQTLERVMDPSDWQKHSGAYPEWIQADPNTSKPTLRLECRMIAKDGRKTRVYVTARKVIVDGTTQYAIGLIDRPRDVIDLTKHPS